jgi:hypothetical protein
MICSRRRIGPWWADVVMVTAPPVIVNTPPVIVTAPRP